jgi:hypothetical protein
LNDLAFILCKSRASAQRIFDLSKESYHQSSFIKVYYTTTTSSSSSY